MKSHPNPLSTAGLVALIAAGCLLTSSTSMAQNDVERRDRDRLMTDWSETSRMAARAMMEKYGEPDEMTPTRAVWHETGPFLHTVVHAEAVPHRFPMPHDDVLEQFVHYRVPPEMYDELASYDGSVMLERTSGKMSARCDMEPLNILALNLAHAIATEEMDVEEARAAYAEQAMAFKENRSAPLTERLTFEPQPMADAADPDMPAEMGEDGM